MDPAHARRELIRALQLAHAGEWGAVRAYLGHRHVLPHGPEREAITEILKDEVRHRRCVRGMLTRFGTEPDPRCEAKMNRVGRTIACICRVGGWYVPMYGAARLERDNIGEYEVAARLAWHAGEHDLLDDLLHMAEVEWDHEEVLRTFAMRHWLWRASPKWPVPAPRAAIRSSFAAFTADPVDVERRTAFLMR